MLARLRFHPESNLFNVNVSVNFASGEPAQGARGGLSGCGRVGGRWGPVVCACRPTAGGPVHGMSGFSYTSFPRVPQLLPLQPMRESIPIRMTLMGFDRWHSFCQTWHLNWK